MLHRERRVTVSIHTVTTTKTLNEPVSPKDIRLHKRLLKQATGKRHLDYAEKLIQQTGKQTSGIGGRRTWKNAESCVSKPPSTTETQWLQA